MPRTASEAVSWALLGLLAFGLVYALNWPAWAQENPHKDRSQWANSPHKKWYDSQEMNPAARERLSVPFKSCCDNGDVFHTRFRVVEDGSRYGTETYEYEREGRWKLVPADIIQRKKTPNGQPVLFIHKATGNELCFIIDEPGI